MQLINISEKSQELTQVAIEHRGTRLEWAVPIYRRNNFKDISILFNPINSFWSSLPNAQQQSIWECYQDIHAILATTSDLNRLYDKMKKAVTNLYNTFSYADIANWARTFGNIVIPSNILDTYEDKPQNRTYLRNDYYQLALLAVALQPMIPVFGQYIENIYKQVGNNFKEQYALGSMMYTWVMADPGRLRLKDYIDAFVQYEQSSNAAIFKGLGTTELPDWLLAKAMVRKVAIGEISVADNNTSIISNVYHYLGSNMSSLDRNFSKARISEKGNPVDSAGGDEDNLSFAETYKVKQEISDGDIIMLSVYTKKYIEMARKVDPLVNKGLVKACVKAMSVLEHSQIEPHQMILCQWVLARSLSARAIPSLDKPSLLRAMGVTQALLFFWGYVDIAALMSAKPHERTDDPAMFTTEPRVRIGKDMVAELNVLYPYIQRVGGKQQSDRQSNQACRAIELLAYELSKTYWTITLPEALREGVQTISTNTMVAPADVKGQLAKLIIERLVYTSPLVDTSAI